MARCRSGRAAFGRGAVEGAFGGETVHQQGGEGVPRELEVGAGLGHVLGDEPLVGFEVRREAPHALDEGAGTLFLRVRGFA